MKKLETRTINASSGQAIAEALVSISALAIILLASATLYQIMQADIDANKSARVAAWHGTLYQGEPAEVLEGRIRKNLQDTGLVQEVTDFMERGSESLVGSAEEVAFKHESFDAAASAASGRAGMVAQNAGLGNSAVSGVTVSIPLKQAEIFDVFTSTGFMSGETSTATLPYDEVDESYRYHVKSKAALLSNTLTPLNESEFNRVVSDVASDGTPMSYFEGLRGALNQLGFDEIDPALGESGLSTVAKEQSRLLPQQLGTFTP